MAAQNGNIVLLRHLHAFQLRLNVPGDDERRDPVGEKLIEDDIPRRGGELPQIAALHIAQDLKAHRLEMVKIPSQLKTGPGHIVHGNANGFVVAGGVRHRHIEFPDQLRQRDGKNIGQGDHLASFLLYYTAERAPAQPLSKNSKKQKKMLAFSGRICYHILRCHCMASILPWIGGAANG